MIKKCHPSLLFHDCGALLSGASSLSVKGLTMMLTQSSCRFSNFVTAWINDTRGMHVCIYRFLNRSAIKQDTHLSGAKKEGYGCNASLLSNSPKGVIFHHRLCSDEVRPRILTDNLACNIFQDRSFVFIYYF